MKSTKQSGVIIVTHVIAALTPKEKTTLMKIALRAGDVENVKPIHSLMEPEAKCYITVGEKCYWLAETLEEVVALVNARLDQTADQLERIACTLEAWHEQNFGRGA